MSRFSAEFYDALSVTFYDTYFIADDVIEIEISVDGKRETKLEQILLNGSNVTMLVPGGDPGQS